MVHPSDTIGIIIRRNRFLECKQFRLLLHISSWRGLSVCLSVCLSIVCQIGASSLNLSTDLAGTFMGSSEIGDLGLNPYPKHAIAISVAAATTTTTTAAAAAAATTTITTSCLQAKTAELNAVNVKVEELLRSGVEKDVSAGKEVSEKLKTLLTQFDKLSATVDKRIKMAANNVSFQKRVQQVRCDCFAYLFLFIRPPISSTERPYVFILFLLLYFFIVIFHSFEKQTANKEQNCGQDGPYLEGIETEC